PVEAIRRPACPTSALGSTTRSPAHSLIHSVIHSVTRAVRGVSTAGSAGPTIRSVNAVSRRAGPVIRSPTRSPAR
ncbi:hypothetical protein, partial [Microbispora rosea]